MLGVILFLVCLGVFFLLLFVGARRQPTAKGAPPRWRSLTTALGLLLITLVCSLEVRSIVASGAPATASPSVHRIAERSMPPGKATHLQLLVAVRADPGALELSDLHEVIEPLPADATQAVELDVAELNLHASVRLDDATTPRQFQHQLTVHDYDRMVRHGGSSALDGLTVDLGDASPFAVLALDMRPAHRTVALLRGEPDVMAILARPIHAGDRLEEVPSATALATIVAQRSKMQGAVRPVPDTTASTDSVARVMDVVHPVGTLLLVIGVMLVCAGRLSVIQSLVLAAFACVILVSAFARFGFSYHLKRFDDSDPAVRSRAIIRVAHTSLFLNSACHALREQFRRESDPAVRATTVLAAASSHARVADSLEVQDLVRAAAADPTEVVRAAARTAETAIAR